MTHFGGDATTAAEGHPPEGTETPTPTIDYDSTTNSGASPAEADIGGTGGPVITTTMASRGRHAAAKPKPSAWRSVVEWILVLGGALIVAVLIRNFLFTTFWIPSASMEPTLIGDPRASGRHDRVVVNRLSYRFHAVNRGDIVVFTTPPTERPITENGRKIKDLIKRVVGLPGDTVTLRNAHVYIDGKRLDEPYLPAGTQTVPICQQTTVFKIPADSVFVMGDNRMNSQDGRCFGPVKKKTILGRAFVRIWPITKLTWL